jgi:hypothetical protein
MRLQCVSVGLLGLHSCAARRALSAETHHNQVPYGLHTAQSKHCTCTLKKHRRRKGLVLAIYTTKRWLGCSICTRLHPAQVQSSLSLKLCPTSTSLGAAGYLLSLRHSVVWKKPTVAVQHTTGLRKSEI